ncbi:hypothetical protein IEQ34_006549 [Dendrobium chrysotoxum]|uniref:Uncharacterized protein n=1 Tax=Dendrobium chrysotoxum TaxID=161865 RepID=A0AAV7H873_DENCH|nr:hypothetical protein IEQ34_006549 [Dendrobium chrysotoxum]
MPEEYFLLSAFITAALPTEPHPRTKNPKAQKLSSKAGGRTIASYVYNYNQTTASEPLIQWNQSSRFPSDKHTDHLATLFLPSNTQRRFISAFKPKSTSIQPLSNS